jgi:hypothetical protein
MTNQQRAEIAITIMDITYIMRPTLHALCSIEGAIGKSLVTVIAEFEEKGLTIAEQIAIIRAGILAGQQKIPKNLEQKLYEMGLANLFPIVIKFLQQGLKL